VWCVMEGTMKSCENCKHWDFEAREGNWATCAIPMGPVEIPVRRFAGVENGRTVFEIVGSEMHPGGRLLKSHVAHRCDAWERAAKRLVAA
jgi:hypothetical protein